MKPKRSTTLTVILVVLAICTSILLSSCASTGKGKKDSEPVAESSEESGKQSVAAEQSSVVSPEVKKQPVAYTGAGVADQPQYGQDAGVKPKEDGFRQYAVSLKQALDGILPEKLSELDWNRISTVLVGLLILFMIYGLAFALGRLPARKHGTGRPGVRQTVEQAPGSVAR